jgi:hypothetical protein
MLQVPQLRELDGVQLRRGPTRASTSFEGARASRRAPPAGDDDGRAASRGASSSSMAPAARWTGRRFQVSGMAMSRTDRGVRARSEPVRRRGAGISWMGGRVTRKSGIPRRMGARASLVGPPLRSRDAATTRKAGRVRLGPGRVGRRGPTMAAYGCTHEWPWARGSASRTDRQARWGEPWSMMGRQVSLMGAAASWMARRASSIPAAMTCKDGTSQTEGRGHHRHGKLP